MPARKKIAFLWLSKNSTVKNWRPKPMNSVGRRLREGQNHWVRWAGDWTFAGVFVEDDKCAFKRFFSL